MVFLSSILSCTLLASLAAGAAVGSLEERGSKCPVYRTGYLAANVEGEWKSFTLSKNNQLSYFGNKKNPLFVEFQACEDLQPIGPSKLNDVVGRLYVPSHKKCIHITNQADATGPYFTTLKTCSEVYAQRFLIIHSMLLPKDENFVVYWLGMTDEEGTTLQGGCGTLGYKSYTQGVPVTTQNSARVTSIVCGGHPYHLAKEPH